MSIVEVLRSSRSALTSFLSFFFFAKGIDRGGVPRCVRAVPGNHSECKLTCFHGAFASAFAFFYCLYLLILGMAATAIALLMRKLR